MQHIITRARRGLSLGAARRSEAGMSTVEYSVGTLGACTVGGVLVKIGQSEWFGDMVKSIIDRIPDLLPF